jgi:hypothetical protein
MVRQAHRRRNPKEVNLRTIGLLFEFSWKAGAVGPLGAKPLRHGDALAVMM